MTACLLSFALLLGMIPANEVSAAKKVSLSTKKLTVTKGKSKTLKVKNTKKKVKWKILSGKKYISLKKKGKVAVSVKGKKNGFKITWKKVSGVKGYQIKYSTNKYFFESLTRSKNVKKAKTTSATVKDLRKGKTYFVKVRTYKIVKGKKVYSNWSKVKTVTAK